MSNPQALRLFSVTLPWNPANDDEGDYANSCWALSHSDAIRTIAMEMAESPDSGCETQKEREKFVAVLTAHAGPYAADNVADRIMSDVRNLLAGPDCAMSADASKDLEAVMAVLGKYGLSAGKAPKNDSSAKLRA